MCARLRELHGSPGTEETDEMRTQCLSQRNERGTAQPIGQTQLRLASAWREQYNRFHHANHAMRHEEDESKTTRSSENRSDLVSTVTHTPITVS